jgi:hypothetical protein
VSSSLVAYTGTLPVRPDFPSGYSLVNLAVDLADHAKSHITLNAKVIPVLQTLNVLVEGGALDRLAEDDEGLQRSVGNSERHLHDADSGLLSLAALAAFSPSLWEM